MASKQPDPKRPTSLQAPGTQSRWSSLLGVYLVALVIFVLLEALVFRSGFYAYYLEPNSSTGIFESVVRDETKRKALGPDEVVVIGDSRIGMGFSATIANENRGERGYFFANTSVPGTTPRCWYYELRDLDPTRRRYAAIVIPVESYDDVDVVEDMADRILDLRFVAGRLRTSDVVEFPFSFRTARMRFEALRGSLFKGFVYQSDMLSFMEHYRKRIEAVELSRKYGWEWRHNFRGNAGDLSGLSVDWALRKVKTPETIAPAARSALERVLLSPPAPETGKLAAYRRRWFGKIIDLYRQSNTRLVFMALPRGPVIRPDPPVHTRNHSIRDFAERDGALLLPERLFESLERPEYYYDGLHLNAKGRAVFSALLAGAIRERLGPSRN